MKFVTFNVLHMCHEFKYNYEFSHIITKYGLYVDAKLNEIVRMTDILSKLKKLLLASTIKKEMITICLQEVNGDLLKMIKEDVDIMLCHIFWYEVRKPKNDYNIYNNCGEFLVSIMGNVDPKVFNAHYLKSECVQYSDLGKAALIIHDGNMCIINTHLPFKENGLVALKDLAPYIGAYDVTIVCGDFNVKWLFLEKYLKKLDYMKYLSFVSNLGVPTCRINRKDGFSVNIIDHVLAFQKSGNTILCTRLNVIDDNLSDHSIVECDLFMKN